MSNLENHNPQVIRQISKEVKTLSSEHLEGIKISINESNLTDIQATIEGPGRSNFALKLNHTRSAVTNWMRQMQGFTHLSTHH
jgi:ubiquitin-protein ligase